MNNMLPINMMNETTIPYLEREIQIHRSYETRFLRDIGFFLLGLLTALVLQHI